LNYDVSENPRRKAQVLGHFFDESEPEMGLQWHHAAFQRPISLSGVPVVRFALPAVEINTRLGNPRADCRALAAHLRVDSRGASKWWLLSKSPMRSMSAMRSPRSPRVGSPCLKECGQESVHDYS
jgi:hypothetical protein